MVTYVDMCFLSNFLWERFNDITPRPVVFEAVTMGEVVFGGEMEKKKRHPYIPRA